MKEGRKEERRKGGRKEGREEEGRKEGRYKYSDKIKEGRKAGWVGGWSEFNTLFGQAGGTPTAITKYWILTTQPHTRLPSFLLSILPFN